MTEPAPAPERAMAEIIELPVNRPAASQTEPVPSLLRLIREDVSCVRLRDPAARSELETLFTYPGVHAVIWHRLAHSLWRRGWLLPARLVSWLSRFLTNVDIHPGAAIGRRLFIDHGAGVVIGETAEVGDDVTMYHGVTLGGTTWSQGKRHPTLQDGVVVGAGAKVLGPIVVGRGTRVGANSVVVKGTPEGSTVVGIPAKEVRPEGDRRRRAGRIDLDHHRMPDPVGEALTVMLDRIDFLETRLAHMQKRMREDLTSPRAGSKQQPPAAATKD